MNRLQQDLLRRELTAAVKKDPDAAEDIEDFAFKKMRDKARKEIDNNLAYLMYRNKYNLPPNDPRFLDLTDEDIVYELILQAEFSKWEENRYEEETPDDNRIIYRNTEEYDSIAKRLDRGEDVDLQSMMSSEEDWEKIDASHT